MTTNDDTPSRRALLKIAATAAAAVPMGAAKPAGARDTAADAELIALCGEYAAAVDAYNADGGDLELEDDPLWEAIERSGQRLDGLVATTMAGVLAKARVAERLAHQPDGRVDYCSSYTGDWPEQVICDLLRLCGGAAA